MSVTGRKLGVFGAMGLFFFWLTASYLFVAVMGYGFLADLNFIAPPFPLSGLLTNLEREYSELAPYARALQGTKGAWRPTLGTFEMAIMDGALLMPQKGLFMVAPTSMEPYLRKEASGMKQWYEQTPAMKEAWQRWTRGNPTQVVVPDPYGFPLLPLAEEKTLFRWFSRLQGSAHMIPTDDSRTKNPATLREIVAEVGSYEGYFNFPLVWRHQQYLEQVEKKQVGLKVFLVLALLGALGSLFLMRTEMPDFGEIEFLRLYGVVFGISAFFSIGNFRTCYMMGVITDDQKVDAKTLETIRDDCRQYIDALQHEEKITPADRKTLLDLLNHH